jgi:transcriptional regulator of met regulon
MVMSMPLDRNQSPRAPRRASPSATLSGAKALQQQQHTVAIIIHSSSILTNITVARLVGSAAHHSDRGSLCDDVAVAASSAMSTPKFKFR